MWFLLCSAHSFNYLNLETKTYKRVLVHLLFYNRTETTTMVRSKDNTYVHTEEDNNLLGLRRARWRPFRACRRIGDSAFLQEKAYKTKMQVSTCVSSVFVCRAAKHVYIGFCGMPHKQEIDMQVSISYIYIYINNYTYIYKEYEQEEYRSRGRFAFFWRRHLQMSNQTIQKAKKANKLHCTSGNHTMDNCKILQGDSIQTNENDSKASIRAYTHNQHTCKRNWNLLIAFIVLYLAVIFVHFILIAEASQRHMLHSSDKNMNTKNKGFQ